MSQLRTSTEDGSTLRIDLDNRALNIDYRTADNFAIFPINEESLVNRLVSSQDWKLNSKFVLKYENPTAYPFPSIVTIGEALTKFCDLSGLIT